MLSYKKNFNDFQVRELLDIPLLQSGEYLYLYVEKVVQNTQDMIKTIAKILKCSPTLIGYCGLKDKNAVCYQWISLGPKSMKGVSAKELIARIHDVFPVMQIGRGNKALSPRTPIRNEFYLFLQSEIKVTQQQCIDIRAHIEKHGFPNVYGEQRFGWTKKNHRKGHAVMHGHSKEKNAFEKKFSLQAYTSHICNEHMQKRLEDHGPTQMFAGDIVVGSDDTQYIYGSGKLYTCEFSTDAQPAYAIKGTLITDEIQVFPTVPVWGDNMPMPPLGSDAQKRETRVLESLVPEGLDKPVGLWGRRRPLMCYPEIKRFHPKGGGYILNCVLMKGSYMTSLLDYANRLLANPSNI